MTPIQDKGPADANYTNAKPAEAEKEQAPEAAGKTGGAAVGKIPGKTAVSTNYTKMDRSKVPAHGGGATGGEIVGMAKKGLFSRIADFFRSLFRPRGMMSSGQIRAHAIAKVQDIESKSEGLKINEMVRSFKLEFQECEGKHLGHKAIGKDIWRYLSTGSIKWNGKEPEGANNPAKVGDLFAKLAALTIKDDAKRTAFLAEVKEMVESLKDDKNAAEIVDNFVVGIDAKAKNDPAMKSMMRLLFMFSQNTGVTGAAPVRVVLPSTDTEDPLQKHLFTVASRADKSIDSGKVEVLGIGKPETKIAVQVSPDGETVSLHVEVDNNLQRYRGSDRVTESCVTCTLNMTIPLNDPQGIDGSMKYAVSTPKGGIAAVSQELEKVLRYEGVEVEKH